MLQSKIPVILDTDIGGDPDDVFALNLLLNSQEVAIKLIVTADEHEDHRARFARQFVLAAGHDIPVVSGASLGRSKYCHVCRAAAGYDGCEIRSDVAQAVVEVLSEFPDARYLCIAPESNLAVVVPVLETLGRTLPVRIMGGAIKYRRPDKAEYNIRHDVAAAQIVFASPFLERAYVISDTTYKTDIEITAEHEIFRRIAASPHPHHRLMADNCRAFFAAKYPSTIMHDPLAAASLFVPELVQFDQVRIAMDDIGRFSVHPNGRMVQISMTADYPRLMSLITERL